MCRGEECSAFFFQLFCFSHCISMPDCPTVQSRRFGSETPRRDETRRDEATRATARRAGWRTRMRGGSSRRRRGGARTSTTHSSEEREQCVPRSMRGMRTRWLSFLTRFETRRRRLGPDLAAVASWIVKRKTMRISIEQYLRGRACGLRACKGSRMFDSSRTSTRRRGTSGRARLPPRMEIWIV